MSIVTFVAVTFGLIGFSMAGIAFWAVMYHKAIACRETSEKNDFCVRVKNHQGRHMSPEGKEFQ